MAWRVNEDDVIDVITVEDPDGTVSDRIRRVLSSAIDAANALTDKVQSMDAADDGPQVLTAALLVQIEKYTAAHFAQSFAANQQVTAESSLGASSTFQGQTGMRLEATFFGQHAMLLDVSGILNGLNEGIHTVGVEWLGLPPSEQTDYEQRD